MNILIFSTDDHLYPAGGAENAMGEITKRLSDIQFDLICARLRKEVKKYEELGNVRIHRIGFGIPRIDRYMLALFGHRKALSLYRQYSHDLVWSIMASYGAFSAVRVKERANIPFLLTLQEGTNIKDIMQKVRFVQKQFKGIFKSADALQSISRFLQSWGHEMGFAGSIDKVIPNGVDIPAFTADFSTDELNAKRRTFGFKDNATILVTTSRLEVKNGVGDIIDSLPFLPENVCLLICGSGSLERELRNKIKEQGLEERVRFLGFLPIKELPMVLKASDIFIRPSLSEGLGNAFLEAMAAEIPVIGTARGGITDFLKDNVTGFLCEPENCRSVASAVKRVLVLSAEERAAVVMNAKNMVIKNYDWAKISASMRDIFNTLNKKV